MLVRAAIIFLLRVVFIVFCSCSHFCRFCPGLTIFNFEHGSWAVPVWANCFRRRIFRFGWLKRCILGRFQRGSNWSCGMVSVSFIPSVVSGKLAINTVELNSRKVSCFHLSIYCLCRTTFHYAMREWAEFFIFDVRTDSSLCWVLNCYIKMLEILLFWYNFVMNNLKLLI